MSARRAHRRLLDRTALAADADKVWFAANPHRNHRVRLATRHEAAAAQLFNGFAPELIAHHADAVILTVVHQLALGVRLRRFVLGALSTSQEVPESIARGVWAFACGEQREEAA